LTRACRANLSQVFGLYPDPAGEVQGILDKAVAGQPPVEAVDHLGVKSRLWPVSDEGLAAKVAGIMGPKPVFIADGHHRYETACNYRDEVAAALAASHGGALLPADHPANFVLMMLVGMSDPGLVVLPTHRLFEKPAVGTAAELAAKLGDCFELRPAGNGPEAAHQVWEQIELESEQGVLGFYTAGDRQWTLATITPAGRSRMDRVAADHGDAWRSLGVSILHRLVIGELLGAKEIPTPGYVHLVREVVEGLDTGDAVVLDATNPLAAEARELELDPALSGAELVRDWIGSDRVVKAFNTTGSGNMANPDYGAERPMMVVAGDDDQAKQVAIGLADEIGFAGVDGGPLPASRDLEHLAMLWIRLAYKLGNGPDIAYALLRR
ncbi:MAG: DUF1015 family protein, partial [Solirubrobacterales bacterium]|nr:DUF1015 family protein [Solirubrobacterales bacterium]